MAAAIESKIQELAAIWASKLFAVDDGKLSLHRADLHAHTVGLQTFLLANHADHLSQLDPQAWKGTYGEARD